MSTVIKNRLQINKVVRILHVFLLFGIMIYVTSKDIPDNFGMTNGPEPTKLVFPVPEKAD